MYFNYSSFNRWNNNALFNNLCLNLTAQISKSIWHSGFKYIFISSSTKKTKMAVVNLSIQNEGDVVFITPDRFLPESKTLFLDFWNIFHQILTWNLKNKKSTVYIKYRRKQSPLHTRATVEDISEFRVPEVGKTRFSRFRVLGRIWLLLLALVFSYKLLNLLIK